MAQLIVIFIMVVTILFMKRQIDVMEKQILEMRKIEKEKQLIAIQSLIEELKYNSEIVASYIQHSEEGANVDRTKRGFSWEWNAPRFASYERYLAEACREDLETSKDLMNLYSQLESCKTIICYIHQLLATNIIELRTLRDGEKIVEEQVKKFNEQIYNISKGIKDKFTLLIDRLQKMM